MRIFNAIKDLFDKRDHVALKSGAALPAEVDLRQWDSPIRNQQAEGSCTSFAGTAILSWLYKRYNNEDLVFSPQFLYRAERLCEGDPEVDGGAQSRTMMAVMNEVGVCLESSYPYVNGAWKNPTPNSLLAEAKQYKIGAYHRIPDLDTLKSVLASQYPASIAIDVFESFESDQVAQTGMVPIPGRNEKSVGGHEVMVVGYNDNSKVLIVRNSWGSDWGDKGYFYLPYGYWPDVLDSWVGHFNKW